MNLLRLDISTGQLYCCFSTCSACMHGKVMQMVEADTVCAYSNNNNNDDNRNHHYDDYYYFHLYNMYAAIRRGRPVSLLLYLCSASMTIF